MTPTMNSGGPLQTAILRGAYQAIGAALVAFLPAYAVTDDLKGPIISGALAALWALGFRGAAEGLFDRARDNAGETRQSDVTPNT